MSNWGLLWLSNGGVHVRAVRSTSVGVPAHDGSGDGSRDYSSYLTWQAVKRMASICDTAADDTACKTNMNACCYDVRLHHLFGTKLLIVFFEKIQ